MYRNIVMITPTKDEVSQLPKDMDYRLKQSVAGLGSAEGDCEGCSCTSVKFDSAVKLFDQRAYQVKSE